MRIFAVELRRTWLFWAIPPLTALWLWMMLTRTGAWKGTWTGATTYADTPASYAVIALCAIIGSASAQRRKNGFYAYLRTSYRSPLTVFGVRLLVILILSFIPFVVAFAVAWTINVPRAPHGFFYLRYAAYAALSLAAALTLADLVGLVTPSPVVGAVAGAAIGLISSFYGDIPLSVAPDLEMSPGQIRLSLGLAITCVCAA